MHKELTGWRMDLHKIIFESDTFKGKAFDVVLVCSIILSVVAVMLESVASINLNYGNILRIAEWFFTILFTIEYILRLLSVKKPLSYATSFYGIIDLIAILPTYLSIIYFGLQSLLVFRVFRLLRLFRTLKMVRYVSGAKTLVHALHASKAKIVVFLTTIISVVIIMGSLMYIIEGPINGFTNIPTSMYWAVVTMTTVGFGDIVPHTVIGKIFASILMILGYGIIAVPTGIVSSEMINSSRHKKVSGKACDNCGDQGHDYDAKYCKMCGGKL
ncbi:MAG: ion transporter [Candidatus Woesearchaeota archaeon]